MKILIGQQIKLADKYTIERQGIDSLELMERAAESIAQWLCHNVEQDKQLLFFIGKGNNGGDGLAVARMLSNVGYRCQVYIPEYEGQPSEDMYSNMDRLPDNIPLLSQDEIEIGDDTVIIDAILGSGVKDCVRDPYRSIIELINSLSIRVISIDLPSGMRCEFDNSDTTIVNATTTLTIEYPKLPMMLSEVGECCGKIEVIPIDLDLEAIEEFDSPYSYTTNEDIASLLLSRTKFGYKNQFGHTLLICGSLGMSGAAILTTSGALRSGCGLVTTHIPFEERFALHASSPSAMISIDRAEYFTTQPTNIEKYSSIVVGPGLGVNPQTVSALKKLLKSNDRPMVIDADALNILSTNRELMSYIPKGSILTPHLGELKRLAEWNTREEKFRETTKLAQELECYIIVKGAHTAIFSPDGNVAFNSTGCSGMAKGGCGDILAGFIGGLLARGYNSYDAARIGVYIHGVAGQKAADYYGVESMNSSDIIDFLSEAMLEF